MKKIGFVVAKIFLFLLCAFMALPTSYLLLRAIVPFGTAALEIENRSGLMLESVEVDLCGWSKKVQQIKPEETAGIKFDFDGDCHYSIRVQFENQKTLSGDFGYVTGSHQSKDRATIHEDGIGFDNLESTFKPFASPKFFALIVSWLFFSVALYKATLMLVRKVSGRL